MEMPLPTSHQIEGYAIVSEDGMLADENGVMPESLKFDADRAYFERALDRVDLVVHGAHSNERQPHSPSRRRLIVTRRIPAIAPDPSNGNALLWNPAGASFEEALSAVGTPNARVGVVGGPDVFGMFLDRYDFFHLTRAPNVWLPGGRPVFPQVVGSEVAGSAVVGRTPEDVLACHGLEPDEREVLDGLKNLAVVSWRRTAKPK